MGKNKSRLRAAVKRAAEAKRNQSASASKVKTTQKAIGNILELIRTKPGFTKKGKPFDHVVEDKVSTGEYRLECIPAEVLGTARPIEVYRAKRAKGNIIKPWPQNPKDDRYCPAHWADIAVGRGACGFRCRECFLTLTHRLFCDPSRHVLYENLDDIEEAVRKELLKPGPNLGDGLDCSDSLLYEGVTGLVRRLAPLFADKRTNPFGRKLILLTKSINVRYLEGLPTTNILATFSLNPEPIADLWEGKWNDGLRITPHIKDRLAASAKAEDMGFEVRWRIDPILPADNWADIYWEFFLSAACEGHRPTRITLGTYRAMGKSLQTFHQGWGLTPIEWTPGEMVKDGEHYHLPEEQRLRIYQQIIRFVKSAWRPTGSVPVLALCKEPRRIRAAVGLDHKHCNCE